MARKASPKPETLRLDGYIRVSQKGGREGDSYISPDEQRKKIEAWAVATGHEIIRWEKPDEDQSGGKLHRPGLDRILKRIHARETDGIAVARLDRLSRLGQVDRAKLIEDITTHGGTIASAAQGILDNDNPVEGFQLDLWLAIARMQRQQARDGWRDAQYNAAARGVASFRPPYGYKVPKPKTSYRDRRQDDERRFEPDAAAAPVVREIWKRRAAGETLPRILDWLVRAGVRTPRGHDPEHWTVGTISGILRRSDTYLGHLRIGDELYENTHPPLITPAIARAAKASPRTIGLAPPLDLLLRRFVRCAGCRSMMTYLSRNPGGGPRPALKAQRSRELRERTRALRAEGKSSREIGRELGISASYARKLASGSLGPPIRTRVVHGYTRHYLCQKAHHGGHCPVRAQVIAQSGPRSTGLEEYVVERMFERLEPIEAEAVAAKPAELSELEDAVRRAKDNARQFARDTEFEEQYGQELYNERLQALKRKAAEAEQAYHDVLNRTERLEQSVRRLADDWQHMSIADRHAVLSAVMQAVFVRQPTANPERVAELRRLREEGLTYREIAERTGETPMAARRQITNPHAKGAHNAGATPNRIHVVWKDEPEVDVPRRGRTDYVQRPFVFPEDHAEPLSKSAELSELAARAYEDYLRKRFPDVLWVARSVPQ